jgi:hypothetical protein
MDITIDEVLETFVAVKSGLPVKGPGGKLYASFGLSLQQRLGLARLTRISNGGNRGE